MNARFFAIGSMFALASMVVGCASTSSDDSPAEDEALGSVASAWVRSYSMTCPLNGSTSIRLRAYSNGRWTVTDASGTRTTSQTGDFAVSGSSVTVSASLDSAFGPSVNSCSTLTFWSGAYSGK